jgi:hypothetical protein
MGCLEEDRLDTDYLKSKIIRGEKELGRVREELKIIREEEQNQVMSGLS